MATAGVMRCFNPAAPVYYADDDDRQLDFTQTADGNVSVRVRYGLTEINQLFQERIFIRRNSFDQSFVITHPVLKRSMLRALENGKAYILTVNGPITGIKKRNANGDDFLYEIHWVILVMQ